MAFKHFALTLNGGVQRLSDVYGKGANVVDQADNVPYRQLTFQSDPANAAAVFVGSTNAVSSANHGFSVDPTQASQLPIVLGPFDTGPLKLSDFFVIGTNNERLMIGGVPF